MELGGLQGRTDSYGRDLSPRFSRSRHPTVRPSHSEQSRVEPDCGLAKRCTDRLLHPDTSSSALGGSDVPSVHPRLRSSCVRNQDERIDAAWRDDNVHQGGPRKEEGPGIGTQRESNAWLVEAQPRGGSADAD